MHGAIADVQELLGRFPREGVGQLLKEFCISRQNTVLAILEAESAGLSPLVLLQREVPRANNTDTTLYPGKDELPVFFLETQPHVGVIQKSERTRNPFQPCPRVISKRNMICT